MHLLVLFFNSRDLNEKKVIHKSFNHSRLEAEQWDNGGFKQMKSRHYHLKMLTHLHTKQSSRRPGKTFDSCVQGDSTDGCLFQDCRKLKLGDICDRLIDCLQTG